LNSNLFNIVLDVHTKEVQKNSSTLIHINGYTILIEESGIVIDSKGFSRYTLEITALLLEYD